MKTINFKQLAGFALGFFVFSVVSCSPDTPTDERKNKQHEEPVLAICTLQEGTLKGGKSFDSSLRATDFQPSATPAQEIKWAEVEGKGWIIHGAVREFVVKNVVNNPTVVYRLKMTYYDADGKEMNNQFYTAGQDNIHQHFFCTYDNGKRIDVKASLPYDYKYIDELNGNFIGETDPLGLDGLIVFKTPAHKFDLSIELAHAAQSKFGSDGKPSPFYLPSQTLISTADWDVSVKVPVNIK